MSLVQLLIELAVPLLVCGFLCWVVWKAFPASVPVNWRYGLTVLFVTITVICVGYFVLDAFHLIGAVNGIKVPDLGSH